MDGKGAKLTTSRISIILWSLLLAFIARVGGQMMVAMGIATDILPPMEEWHSGLLPYPLLVIFQIMIIILYGKICLDFSEGKGFWVNARRGLGIGLLIFGSTYLAGMLLRYIIRMAIFPEERWLGGTIPIFLHWVLALFLLIVGHFHWKYSER